MAQFRVGDRLTATQYERMTEDDQYISEMSRGMLVREPRPGALHTAIAADLYVLLRKYVDEHDLGRVVMEGGFRLSDNPLAIRGPDVAFITKARLPAKIPVSWWPFAPDLAVEVLSPSRSAASVQEKISEYFEHGTREAWVVESRSRSVLVYRSVTDISIVRHPDEVDGGILLPGLRLRIDTFLPVYS
jgi:Uma2 family endonuclease